MHASEVTVSVRNINNPDVRCVCFLGLQMTKLTFNAALVERSGVATSLVEVCAILRQC